MPKCDGCYYCSRYGCNAKRGGHCAKLMKAIQITTATGQKLIVEAATNRCWHSEEIAEIEINVKDDTLCDICERPLNRILTVDAAGS